MAQKTKGAKRVNNYIVSLPSGELSEIFVEGHLQKVFTFIQAEFNVVCEAIEAKSKSHEESSSCIAGLNGAMVDSIRKRTKASSPTVFESLM